jgi:hypothetical protein
MKSHPVDHGDNAHFDITSHHRENLMGDVMIHTRQALPSESYHQLGK